MTSPPFDSKTGNATAAPLPDSQRTILSADLSRGDLADSRPVQHSAPSAPGQGNVRSAIDCLEPWIDLIGLVAAAVAWQNLIAWVSWVWLLPGAALGIALAAVMVAAGTRLAQALSPGSSSMPESGLRPNPVMARLNLLLFGLLVLGCFAGLIRYGLWVMPGDMLGLGLMTGFLAAVFISKQIPDSWWIARLALNGSVVGVLLLLASMQRLPPLLHGLYIAALVAVVVLASRSRQGPASGIPREVFGALIFALGVGIAPHFMASQGIETWLGREFLACLLVIIVGRLCFSWAKSPGPARYGTTVDSVAWIHRRPVLREWLAVILGATVLAGGLMLADPSGRTRWLGAAVMICALWQVPVLWRLRRDRGPIHGSALQGLVMVWSALGPASGPAILWWARSLLD